MSQNESKTVISSQLQSKTVIRSQIQSQPANKTDSKLKKQPKTQNTVRGQDLVLNRPLRLCLSLQVSKCQPLQHNVNLQTKQATNQKTNQNTNNKPHQNCSTANFRLNQSLSKELAKIFLVMGKDLSGTIMLYVQGNLNANSRQFI